MTTMLPRDPAPPQPAAPPADADELEAALRAHVETLTTLHRHRRPSVDWQAIAAEPPPNPPAYQPSFREQLFYKEVLANPTYRRRVASFERARRRWKARQSSAAAILGRMPVAYDALLEAHDIFADLRAVGAMAFHGELHPDWVEVRLHAHSRTVVPVREPRRPSANAPAAAPLGGCNYSAGQPIAGRIVVPA